MGNGLVSQIRKLEADIVFYEGQIELYMKLLRPLLTKLEELKAQLQELEKEN